MKIKISDKHYLNSDRFCCWISVEKKSKSGKIYEAIIGGYHKDPAMCFENYTQQKFNESIATSIIELQEELNEIKNEIQTFIKSLSVEFLEK